MSEQVKWVTGPEGGPGRAPLLLDLAHVDLRTLRAMDDPRLAEAVERVLGQSRDLGESWYGPTDPDFVRSRPVDHQFPAGSGRLSPGEERAG
ncbi:hypothetical protein OG453_24975 [Streptomyces sp. NBC_01381]|uniref:hypothetical protein n=1 Tax=Streptomyces sp. NBC_01381 TaxID=2903845 RepID=UPI002254CFD2|nr:hypothetical protein [Streptomyces sp. NBC_01381]MCX4669900.1 hypothetical protein [Streptomyces sp. NBC_01381]